MQNDNKREVRVNSWFSAQLLRLVVGIKSSEYLKVVEKLVRYLTVM